jgi:hypothetical protein
VRELPFEWALPLGQRVARQVAQGLVCVAKRTQRFDRAPTEQEQLDSHRELDRRRVIKRAVEIDEPGRIAGVSVSG